MSILSSPSFKDNLKQTKKNKYEHFNFQIPPYKLCIAI